MNMQDLINEDTRRSILSLLISDSDYQLNQELIGMALKANGKNVTIDALSNQIRGLEEQGFVTTETVVTLPIVTLSDRGLEIADGTSRATGIRDLRPSEIAELKGR